MDGANPYQVFFKVMLPMASPGLISMGIFNFLGMFWELLGKCSGCLGGRFGVYLGGIFGGITGSASRRKA